MRGVLTPGAPFGHGAARRRVRSQRLQPRAPGDRCRIVRLKTTLSLLTVAAGCAAPTAAHAARPWSAPQPVRRPPPPPGRRPPPPPRPPRLPRARPGARLLDLQPRRPRVVDVDR